MPPKWKKFQPPPPCATGVYASSVSVAHGPLQSPPPPRPRRRGWGLELNCRPPACPSYVPAGLVRGHRSELLRSVPFVLLSQPAGRPPISQQVLVLPSHSVPHPLHADEPQCLAEEPHSVCCGFRWTNATAFIIGLRGPLSIGLPKPHRRVPWQASHHSGWGPGPCVSGGPALATTAAQADFSGGQQPCPAVANQTVPRLGRQRPLCVRVPQSVHRPSSLSHRVYNPTAFVQGGT